MTNDDPDQPPTESATPGPSLPPPHALPPYESWNLPPGTDEVSPARRAAILTWVMGGIQLVVFGSCSCLYVMIPFIPVAMLVQQGAMSADHAAMIEEVDLPQAALVSGLLVAPSWAYLILGFGVKRLRRGQTIAVLVLAVTQAIVCGLMLLASIVDGLRQGEPMTITVNVLTTGSVLVFLLFMCVALSRALRTTSYGQGDPALSANYDPREPWDGA